MAEKMRRRCYYLATALMTAGWGGQALAADCHDLTGMTFGNAQIIETQDVTPPLSLRSLESPRTIKVESPFCRVRGTIKPAANSEIRFEVWLPPAGQWNGRFQGVGNGGFAGTLIYNSMRLALQSGYAVAATDTGHTGAMNQSRWAIGHPEQIEDLGWRAIHETAVAGKAVVTAYYGKAATHSYFNGCSTGGRQALVQAQRFPDDYDGIVAGAPAIYWPRMHMAKIQMLQLLNKPGHWLSPEKLSLLNGAVLKSCGGRLGFLDDPGQCRFDPARLQCKPGASGGQCLTPAEVETATQIYSDLRTPDGASLYPGFAPGAETAWSSSMGPSPDRFRESFLFPFPTGFYGHLVFQDPEWDFRSVTLTQLLAQNDNPAVRAVYAENPDLSAFKARGGKLLHYHGWSDPSISALGSIKYHDSVAAKMGGEAAIQSFYRLFLAPGLEHCGGGPGPNVAGGASTTAPPKRDADHDMVAAVARWVEEGVAPDHIIATRYQDGDPAKGISAQRPWCPYPAVARLKRGQDPAKAASYSCTASRARR